jgi:nitrite reductase/ring-hydroxylating ferredoxin subunit
MRLLSDTEIFDLEMERLFARNWLALAHESEIPKTGDFVVRQMGLDPVLVVRQSAEHVNVLLNACSHRGMELERAEIGNAVRFRCPYHGWIFDRDGRFVGAPCAREMYGDSLDKRPLALRKARVEIFAGMIFACWDPKAPSLSDYLGDIRFYLELMFERTVSGLESVGPPQRWVIPANWKCAAEQFAGDAYHTLTLHGSMFELNARGDLTARDATPITGINISTPQGHGLLFRNLKNIGKDGRSETAAPLEALRKVPPHGVPPEKVDEMTTLFDEASLRLVAETPPTAGQIFPNTAVMSTYIPSAGGDGTGPVITIRTWNPRGPGEIEVFSWSLAERSASAGLRQHTRRTTLQSFGSSGMLEQDDAETWPSLTRVARGYYGKQQWMRYPARGEAKKPEGWPGGGLIYSGITRDDNQWNWWKSYYQFMTNEVR